MNKKSVAKNRTNSKVGGKKSSSRKSSEKKETLPFMVIPEQDLKWLKGKSNQVKELFIDCWISDRYGSHWMPLNHSLKPTSFKAAVKILDEAGLFLFRVKSSTRDRRETVCWEVFNLHGSRRRKEDWNIPDSEVAPPTTKIETEPSITEVAPPTTEVKIPTPEVKIPTPEVKISTLEVGIPTSISSESYTESQIQKPSITSHQRLTNSSKEFSEALGVDCFSDDRDRDTAFDRRVTSASSNEGKMEAEGTNPTEVQPDLVNKSNSDSKQVAQSAEQEAPQVLNNESTNEVMNQSYSVDRFSTDSVELCKAQNLASDQEIKTKEYQSAFKAGKAKLEAKFEEQRKQKFAQRQANLRGNDPMTFAERQALEEYKRELEF